ncbi:MAG TPA: DUF4262 domain-containing protein [Tepidisphaeraceae bacterium]|jgi:hypothetical protein|nr:DUF4262 domain-containing protein [Tepidisphaeraceae bacterium]
MSLEQSISEGVRKNGFRILTISDHTPPFAYSVGLMFTYQHPELIILGLNQAGTDILRGMVHLIGHGRRFDAPGDYEIVPTVKVATRPVHPTQHEFYLGFAMGYCREQGRPGGLQAVEVFWPDKQGKFPFQRGCDESVWEQQPRLDQPLGPIELQGRRSARGEWLR